MTAKNIEDIQITIPTEEEQTAIANVLSSMDKEIETLNAKLEKYRNLKTAMMQQLLTAKGRSFSDPVYRADGTVDMSASRRVEFKFRLKDSEMIEEMNRILSQME